MSQKDIFWKKEGDAWYERNRLHLDRREAAVLDPVLRILDAAAIRPHDALEIGCSNGWRLDLLARKYRAVVTGLDPSEQAITEGRSRHPSALLVRGTADNLPFKSHQFDLVIYGFCLYLCDRNDLFRIVAEGDRVLACGGWLIIYDFYVQQPYKRAYHHDSRLRSYKMDYSKLFSANPAYQVVAKSTFDAGGNEPSSEDEALGIVLMKKDLEAAYPLLDK